MHCFVGVIDTGEVRFRTHLIQRLFDTELIWYCGEPAISLHSYTVPLVQWSTCLLPIMRDLGSIPRRVLMWNRDSPVSIVSLHWWPRHDWSLGPCLRRALSQTVTRPLCQQCDNPTWSHTALLSWFHARCRNPPSSFTTDIVGCWGEPCGEPAISVQGEPCEEPAISVHKSSGPPVWFLSWGTRVQPPGGYLCETGILLLALSCYNTELTWRG